jgi:hypothetical protein
MKAARFLGLVSLLFLASCSAQPTPAIQGKWLTPTGGAIEFRRDGSVTMAGPNGSRELNYRLPDRGTIEFRRAGSSAAIQWKLVSVSSDELVIKDTDGAEQRLWRSP